MEDRIRFIDHRGQRILLVDLSHCPVSQVEKLVRGVRLHNRSAARFSAGAHRRHWRSFDHDAIRAVKETAVFDKPFVKKSALVEIEGLPCLVLQGTEELLPTGNDDF
jgi:hypothetical protein